MTVAEGPNVVTSGLVFSYDMNNSRSWQGMPLTNQFAVPTPDGSNNVTFAVNGTGTFQRVYSGTYGGYTITSNDVVYRYDLGTGGCHYHGNSAAIGAGLIPTFRFDYYISPDAANYPTDSYLSNFENYGGGATSGGTSVPNNSKGIWQTVTFSGGTTSASGTQAMFLYPGGCGGSYLASSGYILFKNPQVIFSATNGMVAPFVGPTGARSTTQSLLDSTGLNVITTDSLTYSTSNTFSFNGSSNYMTVAGSSNWAFGQNGTVEQWVNLAGNSGVNNRFWCTVNSASGIDAYLNGATYNIYFHGGLVGTTSTIPTNTWVHLAVTYSSGTIAVYFNGVAQGLTGTTTGYNVTNNGTLFIGQFSGGGSYYLNGSIPIMRVYNKGLTAAEVLQNFNAQRSIYGV